jgi:putative two-component system response regulator
VAVLAGTSSRVERVRPRPDHESTRHPFPDARVIVVDDEPANVLLLTLVLEDWGCRQVIGTTRPSEVVELCLDSEPDIVILDLRMPELDGFRVLELLRPWREKTPATPVVVLTADASGEACERALAAGARDFLTKPFSHREVVLRVGNLLETRKAQLELKRHGDSLEHRVVERTDELERARIEALDRLALAGEYRDDSTQQHAQRVGRTSAQLAKSLRESAHAVATLRRAATLHDIGKIGIPDSILLKPAQLTSAEFEVMKRHALIGGQILGRSTSDLLQDSAQIAISHHERWDGGGYPHGLRGGGIPLAGRIVAVADVFDALTHNRPYKGASGIEEAVAEIRAGSGTHFDPLIVAAFLCLDHEALLAPVGGDQVAPRNGTDYEAMRAALPPNGAAVV